MGGGLMQLVAYGAQDIYLTGNPQITFFKAIYRRHTNFAIESIEQTFNGTPSAGSRVSCTISRNGDLIHKMYLRVNNTVAVTNGCNAVNIAMGGCVAPTCPLPVIPDNVSGNDTSICANDIIDSVEIEIGGQQIDKHYGDWLNIWTQLTTPASQSAGTETLLNLNKGVYSYIPLQFWFNRNPGLALPLIALQYHEVKINIAFNSGGSSCGGFCEKNPASNSWDRATLFIDYIYLDTDERRRFAQVKHEYLIEQLQFTGAETIRPDVSSKHIRLNFNHPIKELIWRATGMAPRDQIQTDTAGITGNNPIVGWMGYVAEMLPRMSMEGHSVSGNYGSDFQYNPVFKYNPSQSVSGRSNINTNNSNATGNVCASAQWNEISLQLNGHERFAPRHSEYFRLVQPLQHHTAIPVNSGIHCYSFAVKPEEHQPSGTCNFSRIDNAVLKLNGKSTMTSNVGEGGVTMSNCILRIYAINYNVLRIMSGMGGLAYSN